MKLLDNIQTAIGLGVLGLAAYLAYANRCTIGKFACMVPNFPGCEGDNFPGCPADGPAPADPVDPVDPVDDVVIPAGHIAFDIRDRCGSLLGIPAAWAACMVAGYGGTVANWLSSLWTPPAGNCGPGWHMDQDGQCMIDAATPYTPPTGPVGDPCPGDWFHQKISCLEGYAEAGCSGTWRYQPPAGYVVASCHEEPGSGEAHVVLAPAGTVVPEGGNIPSGEATTPEGQILPVYHDPLAADETNYFVCPNGTRWAASMSNMSFLMTSTEPEAEAWRSRYCYG